MIIMRNKICYVFTSISLVVTMPFVLFFALIGVEQVFEIKTLYGFIFVIVTGLYITACGCAMSINIEKEFKGT